MWVWGSVKRLFLAPSKGDRLIIFTLNRKDWLSHAEWLGLGLKVLFCKSTIKNTTAQNKNTCNIVWPPDPLLDPWAPIICIGFLALSSALAQSQTRKTGTLLSLIPIRNPLDFATCSNDCSPCCRVSQWHLPVLLHSNWKFWLAEMRRENWNCMFFRVQGQHQILLGATIIWSVTAKLRNCGALEAQYCLS
jgi:hypothetical protein